MRGYNREVYETRVRQKYLEERVLRALHTQKVAHGHHQTLAGFRVRQQERVQREVARNTPFLRQKAQAQRYAAMKEAEKACE